MPDEQRNGGLVEKVAENAVLKLSHRTVVVLIVTFFLWYGNGFVNKVDSLIDAIHELKANVAVLIVQKASSDGQIAENSVDIKELRDLYYKHLSHPHNDTRYRADDDGTP